MMSIKMAGLSLGAALVSAFALSAEAQIDRSDAPVEITAKQTEYLQTEGRGVYTGDVVATQGDSKITTDKLTIICAKTDAPANSKQKQQNCDIDKLIAEGNVYYTAPEVKIRGAHAEYDYPTDTITITGDVISSRGDEGVVRGTELVYHVKDGLVKMTAGDKRVLSIFNTNKKTDGSAPASGSTAAPAAPAKTPG
ncbi:MAG TPA: LptA/OstA family protein [Hyphomonadaceae bacterium]|nr:LptA/OstA family protein [Hyphomonadaceae bacterium]